MPALTALESILEPLAFDKYVSQTQAFLGKWWPILAGIALIILRVIKYILYEDDDKTLSGLIGIKTTSQQRNKLMELVSLGCQWSLFLLHARSVFRHVLLFANPNLACMFCNRTTSMFQATWRLLLILNSSRECRRFFSITAMILRTQFWERRFAATHPTVRWKTSL